MKKSFIIGAAMISAVSLGAGANNYEKFPEEGYLKESQFNKGDMDDKIEMERRKTARSVPVWQAARCIAFTYGTHTLGYDEKEDWQNHLRYFHDYSDNDSVRVRLEAERQMKSLLAKTDVSWKDVHKTYFRECGGYYKITN